MPNDSENLSGAEEYVAVEIELNAPLDPDQEKNLRDELGKIDPQALDSCTITPKKVSLCYDPTRTSRNQIITLVQQIGGKPQDVEIAASPLLEQ